MTVYLLCGCGTDGDRILNIDFRPSGCAPFALQIPEEEEC